MADKTGYYQVEVSNIYGCSSISDFVYFEYVSVLEDELAKHVKVYPNPATEKIWIDIPLVAEGVQIHLFDNLGNEIKPVTLQNGNSYELDIKDLASGMYFINLYLNNNNIVYSFIKR